MIAWPINPPSSGTLTFSLRLAPYCRSCPCDRHDLYLPSIPDSLQTLGRCECVATCALAPLGLRIISPLTFYLSFLGAIWTYDNKFCFCKNNKRTIIKNLAPIFLYLPPTLPHFTRAPQPLHPWLIPNSLGPPHDPGLCTDARDGLIQRPAPQPRRDAGPALV
jgi:hypothetical protein